MSLHFIFKEGDSEEINGSGAMQRDMFDDSYEARGKGTTDDLGSKTPPPLVINEDDVLDDTSIDKDYVPSECGKC